MARIKNKNRNQILVALDKWFNKELKATRLADGQMGREIELPYVDSWSCNDGRNWCEVRIGEDTYETTDASYWTLRQDIARHIIDAVNKANQKRSKNIVVADTEEETFNETSHWWNISKFIDVKSVYLVPKPCKEYGQLQRWLAKYANFELKDFDLYSVGLFGKRGRYDESGMKHFLCHQPSRCKRVLEDLRKARTSGCTLSIKLKNEDEGNYDESVRYETEYYGHRDRTMQVSVRTKSGKEKVTFTIY